MPEGPRCQPAVPGDWGPGPKALVVDQLLGDLRMSPRARRVNQLPPVTRAWVRVPVVTTSCHGRLGTLLEVPRVNQPSRVTQGGA